MPLLVELLAPSRGNPSRATHHLFASLQKGGRPLANSLPGAARPVRYSAAQQYSPRAHVLGSLALCVCVALIYQASLRCTRCFVSLYELWPRCAHLCNSSFGAAALFLSRKLGQLGEPAPSAKCSQNKTLHSASSVHYQGIYCYHS